MQTPSSEKPVRLRFAPSPTGFLHIGGVRTALYNWLYARKHQGQFLLRIEDTDLERSQDNYTKDIMASMTWLGMKWDEEPIFQSKRLETYRQKVEDLIQKGHAYRCYCSEEDVEKMREKALADGKKPMYDRRCRERIHPHREEPYVIRAKIPLEGFVEFTDMIRGVIRFENTDLDDFVLIRSNGAPTYNLSVVVDDVFSRITHIVRGDDHINNTPKQMHLYRFFNYPVPLFAHLSMILGPDKQKLSKRHGAVSANVYRAEGYLPEALLNFLARLGWSHGDQEEFTIQELIQYFSFDHVQKSSAVFNTEKLNWLNGVHIRKSSSERLHRVILEDFPHYFDAPVPSEAFQRAQAPLTTRLCALIQPKVKLMKEMAEQLVPLCIPGAIEIDVSQVKWGKDGSLKPVIQAAVRQVIQEWQGKIELLQTRGFKREGADAAWGQIPSLSDAGIQHQDIDLQLRAAGEKVGVKLGDLAQPMRLVVTGRSVSAGLFELLSLLPWDVVSARLKKIESL